MNKQSMLYTVIFTFTISFVLVTVLAFSNEATREMVELNNQVSRSRAVLNALGLEYSGQQDLLARYEELSRDDDSGLYSTEIEGKDVYAKEFSGQGLWGTIRGVIAFTADLERFVGLEIVEHSETPGLGGRIEEPLYKNQFRGLHIPDDGEFELNAAGGSDPDEGKIDAVTGATGTSRAMTSIINSQVQQLKEILGGRS